MPSAKEHKEYLELHKSHHKGGGGCIIYCTADYDENNTHSHRWQASKRAVGEPYSTYKPQEVNTWSLKKLQKYEKQGGLATAITQKKGKDVASIKPFSTDWHPFHNQAHHIIPSAQIEKCIFKVSEIAKPKQPEMQNLAVGSLLKEPYNNNDMPNMIILPCQLQVSQDTGLPIHMGDHPNYSDMVYAKIIRKFNKAYSKTAEAIKDKVHTEDEKVPPLKPDLVPISQGIYKAIIKLAKAKAVAGKKLNEITDQIKANYRPAVCR